MKKLTSVLVLCVLLVVTAKAQIGQGTTNLCLTFANVTNVAGASTNTYGAYSTNLLNCLGGKDVAISWRFQCFSANAGNFILNLQPAIENGKPNTVGDGHRWIIPANGNTEVVWTTNLTVNAISGLYITGVENTNASGITNSVFMYRVK